MMVWEVIESLERLGGVGVEQYTILASAGEVFEDVNGCFVVMVLRCHTLGGKEGKNRRISGLVQQVSELIQPVILSW